MLKRFLPEFNARFSLAAAKPGSAYRPWPAGLKREEVFSFKHQRTVSSDNTISFDRKRLQIPPGPDRVSYARARVQVHQRLDGSLAICYDGQTLVTYQPATSGPVRVGKFTPEPSPPPLSPARTEPPPDHPRPRYPISAKARASRQPHRHTERQNKPTDG